MPAPPDIAATSVYGQFITRTEAMLAALAAKADEQERRISALEAAAADRQSRADEFAKAFVGAFQLGVAGRWTGSPAPPPSQSSSLTLFPGSNRPGEPSSLARFIVIGAIAIGRFATVARKAAHAFH
jgi:hypothetical protein